MKKYLTVSLLTIMIIPQVAFASWYNPLSWFNGWSFSKKTDTKTEMLENRVKELESRLGTSTTKVVATPTKQSRVNTTTVVKTVSTPTKQAVGVSSKDMINTIDAWIKNTKSSRDSINKFSDNIDYYIGTFTKSRDAVVSLINIETDPYLMNMWKFYLQVDDGMLKISELYKHGTDFPGVYEPSKSGEFTSSVDYLNKSIDNYISNLVKIKSEIPEYYANNEIYIAEFKKLSNNYFNNINNQTTQLYEAQKEYLDTVKIAMTKISDTEPEVRAYISRNRPNYNAINTTIYQPVVIPQIQTPKFTNCTVSGDGVGLQSYVNCSTSSF